MTVTKEQVIKSLHQTIRTLSDTILLLRNGATDGSQHDVAQLAYDIGKEMGLDSDTLDGVRIGATLHDFGIIRVPQAILSKPGKLTPQEYELVKQHPVHGFQLLRGIDFPWPVARMVLQHQERLDGSGYPGGIEADDIIPEARIIAVADVLESLLSDRPWRKALPIGEALDILKKDRGIKYDPAVVDACIALYTKKKSA